MAELLVVFDGACGFCTRCVQWLVYLDRHHRLRWAAAQAIDVRQFGLTESDAREAAWAMDGAGRRWRGAGAVLAALAVVFRVPALPRMYEWLPVRTLADSLYRWVSAHRGRFPGVAPYCSRGRSCRDA